MDPDRYGSKAAALARARAVGIPVPDGFVIPAPRLEPGAEEPDPLGEPLDQALASLGPGPFVVRTSAPTEDLPGASAAGLYASELGLDSPDAVRAAIARCRQAAEAPAVRTYLESLGLSPVPVAVLVQRQVRARWGGVLFTRDPREGPDSEHLVCERVEGSTTMVTAGLAAPKLHRLPRRSVDGQSPAGLPPWAAALPELADATEKVLGGPADVELAEATDGRVYVLQLRPITAFAQGAETAGQADEGPTWTWDAEHNPAPLSPLHASLVSRLDGLEGLPFRLQTVEGFLYTAPRFGPPARSAGAESSWAERHGQLEDRVSAVEELEAAHGSLPDLLAAFDHFYLSYATLAGTPLAASHKRWAQRLGEELGEGTLTRGELDGRLAGVTTPLASGLQRLAALAAGHDALCAALEQGEAAPDAPGAPAFETDFAAFLGEVGALAPAWDIAVPTLAETPAQLRTSVSVLARQEPPERQPHAPGARPQDADFRAALQADEHDDLLFARALAAIRRACLRVGTTLVEQRELAHRDDVFWLDFDDLIRDGEHADRTGLESRVQRRRQRPGPSAPPARTLRGEVAQQPPVADHDASPLRGVGCGGGTARAPAVLLTDPATGLPGALQTEGRIVVCAALLPSTVPWLVGAAGVVTDHGGLLCHGAILARELGLPAVLGTRVATRRVASGEQLWLDADQGVVVKVGDGG